MLFIARVLQHSVATTFLWKIIFTSNATKQEPHKQSIRNGNISRSFHIIAYIHSLNCDENERNLEISRKSSVTLSKGRTRASENNSILKYYSQYSAETKAEMKQQPAQIQRQQSEETVVIKIIVPQYDDPVKLVSRKYDIISSSRRYCLIMTLLLILLTSVIGATAALWHRNNRSDELQTNYSDQNPLSSSADKYIGGHDNNTATSNSSSYDDIDYNTTYVTKDRWPELLKKDAEIAKAVIQLQRPDIVTVEIIPEDSIYTKEYRKDRVRIVVTIDNIVSQIPSIG